MNFIGIFIVLLATNSLATWFAWMRLLRTPAESPQNAFWMLALICLMFITGIAVNRLCKNAWKVRWQILMVILSSLPLFILAIRFSRLLVVGPAFVLVPILSIWFSRRFFDSEIRF